MTWLALIVLGAIIFQLQRRIGRLERQLEDALKPQGIWHGEPVAEASPMPLDAGTHQIVGTVEAEPPAILYAEPRPDTRQTGPAEFMGDEREEEKEPSPGLGFEELFGRKLPIWAGGITLAVAGMLIVKLSIDAGLLSPPVRVIMGLIFGMALIGAAELALRQEERVRDVRVRQALAGAGLASLYASILVAANLYHLVGSLTAMLGMAGVTALALGLSIRFGPPSALLGLAGGLAAPALIGSDEVNVPLLSLYLALAIGGLCTVSRGQRWAWLGISALVGGFGWGLFLMIDGALSAPDSISIGLYLLLIGVALPMLGFAGDWHARLKLIAAIAAAAQMAALVALGGYSLLNWSLFGMISLAMLWLANRETALERLPPVGTIIALLLLGAWPDPQQGEFALVAVFGALIYGAPAMLRLWRAEGGLVEAAQVAAIALGGLFIPIFHFYRADGSGDVGFGLIALAMASISAGAAALGWQNANRSDDARFAILSVSSAVLLAAAASLLLSDWAIGGAFAAIGLALLHLGQMADDRRLEPIAWIFAVGGLAAGLVASLVDVPSNANETLRWGLLAFIGASFAWRGRFHHGRIAAQFLSAILLYAAAQPVIPYRWEPLIAPIMLMILASASIRLVPAMAAAVLILIGWTMVPVGEWTFAANASVFGEPVLVTDVPGVEGSILKLLLPASMLGLSLWLARSRLRRREWLSAASVAAVIATVAVHSLFKQLFAIGSTESFVASGLPERIVWELAILGAAALLWRIGQWRPSVAMLGVAAAHFTLYTLLLHNPLWSGQAVGHLPFINLLPIAYAVPVAILLVVNKLPQIRSFVPDRVISISWMVLIPLFALSMLRQLFHGSLLVVPGLSQAEDISRSILAIALAIGFLLWGIRKENRDWRIASLLLMLLAVAKVFLRDTSGLEGFIRIGAFVALGFSLIGIGWLYSRQLAPTKG